MNDRTRTRERGSIQAAWGAALFIAAFPVSGQDAPSAPGATVAIDPNPYYLGVSQGFTHDSNAYRVPGGPGDVYSSTSVFGGFDQPISRQRVFGKASVSLNRYQDETRLNNTSYDLRTGANLETIENLSGNVNLGLNRSLAIPSASVGAPVAVRNVGDRQNIDATVRWGGPALLTLEGSAGYSRLDYSAPEYAASESRNKTGSLGLYYRPGSALRLGAAARFTRNEAPRAFFDPLTGSYTANTVNGRNLDLLADYVLTGLISTNARLSYTRQTNSGVADADFSGVTGSVAVNWQATAKTSLQFDAAREAGFDATSRAVSGYGFVQTGTGLTAVPITGLYENNRITTSAGLGLNYSATAKISANARARYIHARLVTTNALVPGTAAPTTVDKSTLLSLGARYDISRAWGLGCNVSYERRDVSGPVTYSYAANIVGCQTQFVWR